MAVLIEGEARDVGRLGVDGLHLSAPNRGLVAAAVKALKPDAIVGVAVANRHDAMEFGELGVDYVMFGPLSGPIDATTRELARWWAETMEVPSVLSDPEATATSFDAEGCEFIGLGAGVWNGAR